ncbi:MAG: 2-oxo acid dehydrogenase subunit E2 [Cytophagaceae bacterium]|nr:2-oxo acid dehydrogenase subunit E2 [Cytophagaceae bacterium]
MEKNLNNPWRKTASTIYKKPVDSKILGSVEIDVTDVEAYISQKRKEGLKITLTHFFLLATARAVKTEVPELNTYVKRGNIYSYPSLDATVSVLLPDGEMSSIKVHAVDTFNLRESVDLLSEAIKNTRKGSENKTMKMKHKLAEFPWPIRGWIYKTIKTILTDWGISLPFLGMTNNTFGSFIFSNIGTLGLDNGYPALMPTANVSFVMIMGGVRKKPWVVNDEIVPRKIITLGAALDHRVVDASHAGKLFKVLKYYVAHPEKLEEHL